MKQCPKCQRAYLDTTLNFCLEDGDVLQDYIPIEDFPTEVMPHAVSEPQTRIYAGSVAGEAVSSASAARVPANSIAVLPFAHLSSAPDDEYFCDGLAEELINALAKIDGLKVAARASAFRFKDKDIDVGTIGRQLGVETVLDGSVRKAGNRLRITTQLIGTADGYHLWSERYDREMDDIFEVQDEISHAVVAALKAKLLGEDETPSLSKLFEELKHYRADVEAYQLYLRGRFMFNKFTPNDFWRAVDCFERAIEIEPNFAAAYAALAEVHVFLTEFGPVPALEGMPKAKKAAMKAIELDASLSEAHNSLALVLQEFDFDFAAAEEEYKIAVELNPNSPMACQYYGSWFAQMGQFEEAERMCQKALALDPLSPIGTWIYPFVLFLSRRFDDAISQANKLLEMDQNFSAAHLVLSFANQMKGNFSESVKSYARFLELCELPEIAAAARAAFKTDGWQGFLRAMTAVAVSANISSYINAVHHAALGEKGSAIAALERSFDKREGYLVMVNVDPRFDTIRDEPVFQELLKKIGFPD